MAKARYAPPIVKMNLGGGGEMRALFFRSTVFCIAALTAGCTYVDKQFDASEPSTVTVATHRNATRVLLTSECPSEASNPFASSGLGALVSFVAPLVADTVFNVVDSYFKSREAALTATYTGQGVGNLFDEKYKCLVVSRADFGSGGNDWRLAPGLSEKSGLKKDSLANLGFASSPDLYLEARLEHTPGNSDAKAGPLRKPTTTVTPRFFYFGRTAAERIGSGSKSVYIVLFAKQQTKAPTALGDDTQSAAFKLGKTPIGTAVFSTSNEPLMNPYVDLAITLKGPDDGNVPSNLFVQVTETESPTEFEKALMLAYSENSGKLKSALETIVKTLVETNGPKK